MDFGECYACIEVVEVEIREDALVVALEWSHWSGMQEMFLTNENII
jgi:hypothetical protein